MNFYSLPIIINDRREMLLELVEQYSNTRNNSYIIEVPSLTSFNLLTILRENTIRTFVEQSKDIPLSNIETDCTFKNGVVTLRLFENIPLIINNAEEPEAPKEKLSYEDLEDFAPKAKPKPADEYAPIQERTAPLGNANSHLTLTFESNRQAINVKSRQIREINQELFDQNKLTIRVILEVNQESYSSSLDLYLSHPSQFIGIALDFGSESSQMAVKRYTNDFNLLEKKPEIENLFRNIVSFHKSNGWLEQNETVDFYQEEKNTNFYKSLFFLKEQLSGHYEDIDQEVFIKDIADNLKMLVNTKDGFNTLTQQKFHQLPNLKIIHKHEDLLNGISFEIEKQGYGIPIKLSEIKQKVYNTILKVMIASFLKKGIYTVQQCHPLHTPDAAGTQYLRYQRYQLYPAPAP